jgi:glutamate formiminotransferase/formiminotetrahydrofolate cyclodeaminase
MVGQMTYGKRQFEDVDETIRQLLPPLYSAMIHSVPMIDADTDAFNDYMVCVLFVYTRFNGVVN